MRPTPAALLLALALAVPASWAADPAAIRQQIENGELTAAQQQVDAELAQRPDDPQYRFFRGVILGAESKDDQAIAIFKDLTVRYPELPEPYNNLAVVYAREGRYDEARQALEMAVRANPDYATALENLGDVDARLAARSYRKALRLAPADAARIEAKVGAIDRMLGAAGELAGTVSLPLPAAGKH